MSQKNALIEIRRGIPFVSGGSVEVLIPKNLRIKKIWLAHISGSFSGGSSGSLNANTIIAEILGIAKGRNPIYIRGDIDTDTTPWAIQLLREVYRIKNGLATLTAEFFPIEFKNFSSSLETLNFVFNTLANINDGDRTAYTGTINVMAEVETNIALPESKLSLRYTAWRTTTTTGLLPFFINADEIGYSTVGILLLIEDNGSASNTAVSKITVRNAQQIIKDGAPTQIQFENLAVFGVALGTGFVWIPIKQKVNPQAIECLIEKTSAGTNVDIHVLQVSA